MLVNVNNDKCLMKRSVVPSGFFERSQVPSNFYRENYQQQLEKMVNENTANLPW